MLGIESIVSIGTKLIDRVIPDPAAKAEAQQKLLELQQNGELKLEEFDVKREEIAAGDRDSARKMQIAALDPNNTDKLSKRFIYYYTGFWSIASTLYIGFITFAKIPESNVRFADTILGFILGTAIASMFNYFYGSSSSSKNKDTTIQNMVHKNN